MTPVEPRGQGRFGLTARSVALRTAGLAVLAFGAVALVEERLTFLTLAAAAVTMLVAALFFRDRRRIDDGETAPLQRRAPMLSDAVVAELPDALIIVDAESVVVGMSRAAAELYPALRRGEPLSFALRAPDVLTGLAGALRGGGATKVELTERVPLLRAFEVSILPIRTDADAAPRAMLHFRDLTAARQLEHMRVDFIANASHELRTPLASVLGFVETLQGPARHDPEARDRFLAIMREQAGRMSRLIDDLLSLSRIELSAHLQPETTLDLLPLVQHMIETLSQLAADKNVVISLKTPGGPFPVRGERDELLRVFENLIENAVKYGQSGGRVDVAVDRLSSSGGRDEVQVSVRDFGPGIAPEHLPRLTERFYRIDVTASRQKGGTGLGLAIVKHIVNKHRGRLVIESVPGQGAAFRAILPLADEAAQAHLAGP